MVSPCVKRRNGIGSQMGVGRKKPTATGKEIKKRRKLENCKSFGFKLDILRLLMSGTVTPSDTALHFLVVFVLSQPTCFRFSKDIIRLFFSSKNTITAHNTGVYGIDSVIYEMQNILK